MAFTITGIVRAMFRSPDEVERCAGPCAGRDFRDAGRTAADISHVRVSLARRVAGRRPAVVMPLALLLSSAGCDAPMVAPQPWVAAHAGAAPAPEARQSPVVSYTSPGGRRISETPSPTPRPSPPRWPADALGAAASLAQSANALRREQGQPPLRIDSRLADAATTFAQFMAARDAYGHAADGRRPGERAAAAGYRWSAIRENIAWAWSSEGFTTAELAAEFDRNWRNSPPHRSNLLARDVRDIGVGVARSGRTGRYYAVQLLGRQMP